MKCIKIFFVLMSISSMMVADDSTHTEFIQNIKKEYEVIFDKLFLQGREKLGSNEDIAIWLYNKNKEEFKDIQNLMTDAKVEVCFNRNDELIIKKELEEYLKEKIQDEAQKVLDTDGVTAENMKDFFRVSRMVCAVTLESDDACRKMTRTLKKQYRSFIKELKVVDKAGEKIKKIEKKRTKQELLHHLREQIILGTAPRQ